MAHKPLVCSVHGIRTRGRWQKILSDLLSKYGMPVRSLDYGYYRSYRFLRKRSNDRMIEWFREQYESVIREYHEHLSRGKYSDRPCIVAHSFGTYLACYAMLKYDEIRFDKMVLCGCILPRNFPWSTLFARDQVYLVRNEYGAKDFWCRAVRYFVPKTGDSGFSGFLIGGTRLIEKSYEHYKHSDFFSRIHIEETWIPFLSRETPRLQVQHGKEITSVDEFRQIGAQTGEIDDIVYGDLDHYKENAVDMDLAVQWVEVEPDIYTFLIDRKNTTYVGYLNALPVSEELFQRIKTEGIPDDGLSAEDVVPFVDGESVKLYVISVAIHPACRRLGEGINNFAFETLLNGFLDKLGDYARYRRIRVSEIVAVGWSRQGRRICEHLIRMKKIGTDPYGHPIYWMALDAKGRGTGVYRGLKNLTELYDELGLLAPPAAASADRGQEV